MQKKRKLLPVLLIGFIVLIFIGGGLMVFYPSIANYLHEKNGLKYYIDYTEAVAAHTEEEYAAERKKCLQYNASLLGNYTVITDPLDPDAFPPTDGEYLDMLSWNEVMAYIRIPAIQVELPIYHGTDAETLEKGVGHLENTSIPVGGLGSHAVLSAHCGLPTAVLFTNLDKLIVGDVFYIDVLNMTLAYKVYDIEVVEPSDSSSLYPVAGKDLVTLVTCTPYGVNSHRLLVHAKRIELETVPEEAVTRVAETGNWWEELAFLGVGVFCVIFLVIILCFFLLGRKRRKQEAPEDAPEQSQSKKRKSTPKQKGRHFRQ